MKKQGEYDDLITQYNKKKDQLSRDLKMTKIDPNKMTKRFFHPIDVRLVRVFYLGYSRNAWHSTWVSYYYPGDVECELIPLQKRAEHLRTPGSQFWIQTRDAIWFRFQRANVLILQINTRSEYHYNDCVGTIRKNDLKEFWKNFLYLNDNWLLFFEMGKWKPDLISKKSPKIYNSYIQSNGKSLGWKEKTTDLCPLFQKFAIQMSRSVGTGELKFSHHI